MSGTGSLAAFDFSECALGPIYLYHRDIVSVVRSPNRRGIVQALLYGSLLGFMLLEDDLVELVVGLPPGFRLHDSSDGRVVCILSTVGSWLVYDFIHSPFEFKQASTSNFISYVTTTCSSVKTTHDMN